MLFLVASGSVTLSIGTALSDTGSRAIGNIFNFAINTHMLILLDASVLDREAISRYVFTVRAEDSAGQISTAEVTVNILDFNDVTPVITNDG